MKSCLVRNREIVKSYSDHSENLSMGQTAQSNPLSDSVRVYQDSLRYLESFYKSQITRLLIKNIRDSSGILADSIRKLDAYYQTLIDSIKMSRLAVDIEESIMTEDSLPSPISDQIKRMTSEFDSLITTLPQNIGLRERELAIAQISLRLANKYGIHPDSLQKIMITR
jgi:hypothetical protein